MTDGVTIKTNLPQLKAHLARIGKEFEAKAVRQATYAAAAIFRREVQARAPVLKQATKQRVPGTLRRAIYIKRSRDRTSGREHYFVGVRQGAKAAKKGRDAFYWRFLETGWTPRGPGQRLKGGVRSRALQLSRSRAAGGKVVRYPFIAPAYNSSKEQALQAFYTRADKAVAKFSSERTPK